MNKIVVVDDDIDFVKMLKNVLEKNNYDVYRYHSAEEFLCFNKHFDQCLYIIDGGLPGIQGGDVIKSIRHKDKLSPIFMISGGSSMEEINAGLNSGADDYITKPFSVEILLSKVGNAHRKNSLIPKGKIYKEFNKIPETYCLARGDKTIKLTMSEYNIVDSILLSDEKQKSRKELVVDSKSVGITERTIDVHIHAIRKKLLPLDMTILTIRGVGYKILFN
jgi:DNA-binding response OmpR family regulator